jgi:hypothetical protein
MLNSSHFLSSLSTLLCNALLRVLRNAPKYSRIH